MKEKIIPVVAIIALVLSLWSLLSSWSRPDFPIPSPTEVAQKVGAAGNQLIEQYLPYVQYNGGIRTNLSLVVGTTTPADIINISKGTCNLTTGVTNGSVGANNTFAASTTKMHYCAATGVRVGDQIWVTLPSAITGQASSSVLAGPAGGLGLTIVGAIATTSDIIGVALANFTGAATGSYVQATTGVQYLIFR